MAGTATTLQAIAIGLEQYDPGRIDGSILDRGDAERVFRLLADMSTEERSQIEVMPRGREDVIPAGAAILMDVMQRWGFPKAVVREHDILDGIAYRMAEEASEGPFPG